MAAESVHIYIKTSGQGHIAGSSQQKGKEKWIEVMSWQTSRDAMSGMPTGRRMPGWTEIPDVVSPRDSTTGQSTGKRMHKPFVIMKEIDKSSPLLKEAAASGQRFPEVDVDVFSNGKLMHYKLMDVMVSAVSMSSGGDRPMESISLNFTKIEMK